MLYPTGQSGAEDTCQRETYTYDNNATTPGYSQYVLGRLATVQYYTGKHPVNTGWSGDLTLGAAGSAELFQSR